MPIAISNPSARALRNGSIRSMGVKEPFGLDQHEQRLAVAAGNEIRIYDAAAKITHVFHNPWFAQLHSVYFSDDGSRLLTVSTGFDTVLEFDIARERLTWAWNAWDHGYDLTPSGIRIRRGSAPTGPAPRSLVTVDDPAAWRGFGLPTGPERVNPFPTLGDVFSN
ncbi:hypothetical protein [Aquimonas sp.]|uniref:hypothetical protein n=1 Tax=Aquimonas sp. TaxID=1872588 RepID=UPI0037C07F9A